MARQTPKKKAAARVAAAALAQPAEPGGTELMPAERVKAPINARFDIQLGIDDIAAVDAVDEEHRLSAELKRQVGEVNRLSEEIGARSKKLVAIFDETPVDPAFAGKCNALVAAAADLGIKLTPEVAKGNFNPDSLTYSINVKFRGEPTATTTHVVASEHARSLVAEAADLRRQHAAAVKNAEVLKKELDPARLARESKAKVVKSLLKGTDEGTVVLHAMSDGRGQHQLGSE
jgi:hypothetical protein